MRLSKLQQYILKACLPGKKISRSKFSDYYNNGKIIGARKKNQASIITISLERLIDKGLLAGFGERTRFKWFITEVKLTATGKKIARKLLGVQGRLPFKSPKK